LSPSEIDRLLDWFVDVKLGDARGAGPSPQIQEPGAVTLGSSQTFVETAPGLSGELTRGDSPTFAYEETSKAHFQPEQIIAGRYRIETELSRGGMGLVFRAHDTLLNRRVALKFLLAESAMEKQGVHRFLQEAQICLELTHPNIVRVYDIGQCRDTDSIFLAMEYLAGGTLREHLTRRKERDEVYDAAGLYTVLKQVLKALHYAHGRKIIHRDLKPENVMLVPLGSNACRVVVLDFGIAKMSEGTFQTSPHALLGTPLYMAPEQLAGASAVDHRADIFSVGIIAYELLTNQVPQGIAPLPSATNRNIPKEMDQWVARATAGRPSERFQSVQEMEQELKKILSS
jgi:serine/threonine-protein kinase